jgi:hypothetical protein
MKEFDTKEAGYNSQIEDLKFQMHLLYQDYAKQKIALREILTSFREKDEKTSSKQIREQITKKIESLGEDFKDVFFT